MRDSLIDLIKNTILFEYRLPCRIRKIDKSFLTTKNDDCYSSNNINNFITLIYNSILEYAYSEFQLKDGNHFQMFSNAFGAKFKYNHDSTELAKKRLGFYGEVILHSMLHVIYNKDILISRGILFDPLAKSEAPGYDAYHLIEYNNQIHLWFGEVKFYQDYKSAIDKVFKNITKAISDEYLKLNLFSIANRSSEIDNKTIISQIMRDWSKGKINLFDEIKKYKIKLVYPIFIIFQKDINGYDNSIKNAVDYLNSKYSKTKFKSISIEYNIFFIFLPIDDVDRIKLDVIKWIESKQSLML